MSEIPALRLQFSNQECKHTKKTSTWLGGYRHDIIQTNTAQETRKGVNSAHKVNQQKTSSSETQQAGHELLLRDSAGPPRCVRSAARASSHEPLFIGPCLLFVGGSCSCLAAISCWVLFCLSRVYQASCPITAGIGTKWKWILVRSSGQHTVWAFGGQSRG